MKKIFLFGIALLIGLGLLIDNSFFKSGGRHIASTSDNLSSGNEDDNDLSGLSTSDFNKAFKYKLIGPAQLVHADDHMGVQLGNFYIKGTDEQKIFVCSKYNQIELIFEAEGLAVSGDIPRMVVRGPCLVSEDFNSLAALMIPYKNIIFSPLSDHEFHEDIADSQEKIAVYFYHTVEQWPLQWNLVGVKLYSDYSRELLSVNGYEIISILGQPLTLDWSR